MGQAEGVGQEPDPGGDLGPPVLVRVRRLDVEGGREGVRVRAQGAEPDVAQQGPVGPVEPADQEPVTSAKAASTTSRASSRRSCPMTSGGRNRSTLP